MTVVGIASIDVTTLFKSCVKTIHTRNKAIGVNFSPARILPTPVTTNFFNKAKEIQSNICGHFRFLNEHKKKYISDNVALMSDVEKSYMEKVVSRNLKVIEENIKTLEVDQKNGTADGISKDSEDCQQEVIGILRLNFQQITSSFHDMKHQRKMKQKRKDQLNRLRRSDFKSRALTSESLSTKGTDTNHVSNLTTSVSRTSNSAPIESFSSNSSSPINDDLPPSSKTSPSFLENEVENYLQDLDESERQHLEQENKDLYNELMSNHEEVKQITRQVVELSRMQDILTDHVEVQSKQIDDIYDEILLGTDNIQRGNEQVREAMRKDASFRVWIMFFLIVMSCTILFLDWYNP